MAHIVTVEKLSLPESGRITAKFNIKTNNSRFCKLTITTDGIDYIPKGKRIPIKKTWKELDWLFTE